jgi:hypothetical protein
MSRLSLTILAVCLFGGVLAQEAVESIPETVDENGQAWYGPVRKCAPGSDAELEKCLNQVVTDLTPLVADGIPEFGLQPLDPFKLSTWTYDEKFGPITVNIKAKQIKISGTTNYDVMKFTVDTKNRVIGFEYKVPKLLVEANYKLGGNVAFVRGQGPVSMENSDIVVKGTMPFHRIERPDGVKVIQLKNTKVDDMSISKLVFRAQGLFNGNPVLSGPVHYIANQYGPEVFQLFAKGPITNTVDEIITKALLNPILLRLPYLTDYVDWEN